MDSDPIFSQQVVRQDTEPTYKVDGMLWVNPTGGNSGNNRERYTYNSDTDSWELSNSSGPDTPLHAVGGSLWRDTTNSVQKVYDNGWKVIGQTTSQVKKIALAYDLTGV